MITAILCSIAVGLLLHYFWERRRRMKVFERLGIPGPSPNILLGNQLDLAGGPSRAIAKWHQQYGDTFGYFEGTVAVLVTKDLDIIKQVYIKEFSKFTARKPFPIGPDPKSSKNVSVLFAHGHRWKRQRAMLSPTFSTGKLKQTQPLILLGIKNMMEVLEEKAKEGKGFNIMTIFQAMTLDVISSTAFGLDIDAQRNQDGQMIKACRAVFAQQNTYNMPLVRKIFLTLSLIFPRLNQVFFGLWRRINDLGVIRSSPFWLGHTLRQVIKERRESGKTDRRDFLQMLLDAEAVDDMINDNALTMTDEDGDAMESGARTKDNTKGVRLAKKITQEEIVSNSIGFLLAGYETTSTALSYAAQELASNPRIQGKLQEEIDKVVGQELPDHKHLAQMPYLDMVFNEVLRKNTIVPTFITRQCQEAVQVGDIAIPKGMTVQVHSLAIHADPDLWGPTDPKEFDPERFSPENKATRHPLAFQAFGTGPRNCIGMRLALMEGKLALIAVLQKYTLQRCDETEAVLEVFEQGTLVPKNGVHVTLSSRLP
ncbi:cytochrome P450 3A4-like [Lineus longissimus]|uniref:cytochrome P450 3A4-like n=1 Tax=Lineus longissimus TaxID=88925 RepID=UPI002B4FA472